MNNLREQKIIKFRDTIKTLSNSELMEYIQTLSVNDIDILVYEWGVWARNEQLQPNSDWITWLILAGRGWG